MPPSAPTPARRPPVFEVSGDHREVGRQIGEAGRDLIARGLAAYEDRFVVLAGFDFTEALVRSRAYLRPAEDYLPHSVEQLRGLAEGANAPFDRLFALNCSEEFTCAADFVWPPEEGAGSDGAVSGAAAAAPGGPRPAPEHCTSFAVAAGARVVSGHNEDWYPEEIDGFVIRKVRLTGAAGISYLSAGPPYNLPLTGVTSAGFSSAADTVYFRDERVGMPNNLLLTGVLGCRDLEAARDLIARAPRARGSNHLLCDARGRIWDVETSAERWAFIDASASGGKDAAGAAAAVFAHANHYVSPELAPDDATRSEGSPKRLARARELLSADTESGADLVALGKAVLRDHGNAPFSICAHWDDDDPAEDQSVTTASMIWEPAEGRAHIACGQPCRAEYVTYEL